MKHYWIMLIGFGVFSSGLYADDTEIYLGTADRVNPNVIFIFDTSGSMADKVGSGYNAPSRLDLVQQAAKETIDETSGINLALMRYNPYRSYYQSGQDENYRGGFLSTSMMNIDADGARDTLKSVIDSYPADGGTPLTEAVHEAIKYLYGDTIDYGKTKKSLYNSWTYLVPYSTRDGDKYISPITDECQKNHIVLFTDGDSSVDGESNDAIRDLIRGMPDKPSAISTSCSSNGGGNVSNLTDSCIEEIAYYMYHTDDHPQVHFHAIGGFLENNNSQTFLDNAAYYGGGISAAADDYASLKASLTKIFDDISQSAGTFAAPAVAVNAFNSLEQLDQMYYSVFKPNESVGWSGNVKRFRMTSDGIVDAKGNPAVDTLTGFFSKNAQSFWTLDTDAPDGDNVLKGGAASRLTTDRKVVSNIVSNNLADADNRITESNSNITQTLMGTSLSGNEFTKLIQWTRGLDVKGSDASSPRESMEDPLHSRPVLLNYGQITDADGDKIPDSTLFIGTNSGYLHAFDTNENNPKERFAFIPRELLPVTTAYYEGGGVKKYGLDGPISVWHDDTNRDQIINNSEKAYLYVGMRRGGSSYYALDVSNRDNPKLLWQINGTYHSDTTSGFNKLGQSWSKMVPADIQWIDGNKRKVLIFGGGYDPKEDDYSVRTPHDAGNAIFMVDAKTGALLWKASPETSANLRLSNMSSSIVGDVVAVDDDSDGLVELLYVADLGGRIWRIDFDKNSTSANSYATGGAIADLGKDNTKINNVRFYNTLDVVYSKAFSYVESDGSGGLTEIQHIPRYVLNIGSGYRAHPLNDEALDYFYVVFDYNTNGAPSNYIKVEKSDLAEFPLSSSSSEITPSLKSNNGFYIKLLSADAGEKVLSKAVTLNNVIYFSSYRPVDASTRSGCEPDTGNTRLYTLRLASGKMTSQEMDAPGIPSDPVIIQTTREDDTGNEESSTKVLISTEVIDALDDIYPLKKTYWHEEK